MATRAEVQAGQDIIRFMNIINDLFDGVVKLTDGLIKNQDGSDLTNEQKKEGITRAISNMRIHRNQINIFLSNNDSVAVNGLSVFGVTKKDITDDISAFDTHFAQIETLLSQDVAGSKIADISSYKKSNIPELKLVRNA